jgi:hypothetical protein
MQLQKDASSARPRCKCDNIFEGAQIQTSISSSKCTQTATRAYPAGNKRAQVTATGSQNHHQDLMSSS